MIGYIKQQRHKINDQNIDTMRMWGLMCECVSSCERTVEITQYYICKTKCRFCKIVYLSPSYYCAGDCFSPNRTCSPFQRPRSVHCETPPTPPQRTVQNLPCQRNTLTLWRVRSPGYPACPAKQPATCQEWGRLNKRLMKTSQKRQGMTSKETTLILGSFLTPCKQPVSRNQKWPRG